MRKVYIVTGAAVIVVLVALAAGLPGALTNGGFDAVTAQAPQTSAVQRVTFTSSIESTGTITPVRSMGLAFNTSGTVTAVLVEQGDTVSAGQELARLDTASLLHQIALKEQALIVQQASYDRLVAEPTAAEIAQARASVASAQAQLLSAQLSLTAVPERELISCASLDSLQHSLESAQDAYDIYIRDGFGWDANFTPDPNAAVVAALRSAQTSYDVEVAQCNTTTPASQYELQLVSAEAGLEQAQASLASLLAGPTAEEVASAQAQLEQTRLELDNTRAQLDDMVLTAPFDGVIAAVNLETGQAVSSSASVITLVDLSRFYIDVQVDELDIASVAVGQDAVISPDALTDVEINGRVTRIAPTSSISDSIVVYDVRVDLDDMGDLPVRAGMTTSVKINVDVQEGVLAVPTGAIQRSGTLEYIEVTDADGTTRRVPVTAGRTNSGLTAIEGEIEEGALVVIPAQDTMTSSAQQGPGMGGLPIGIPLGGPGGQP